jgi:hypothetical protein
MDRSISLPPLLSCLLPQLVVTWHISLSGVYVSRAHCKVHHFRRTAQQTRNDVKVEVPSDWTEDAITVTINQCQVNKSSKWRRHIRKGDLTNHVCIMSTTPYIIGESDIIDITTL